MDRATHSRHTPRLKAADMGPEAWARVEAHRPLVRALAGRYRWSGLAREDLEAEALLALVEASGRFRQRGVPFGVYARLCMRSRLRAFVRGQARALALGKRAAARGEPLPSVALSLDAPVDVGGSALPLSEVLAADAPSPEDAVAREEVRARVRRATETLRRTLRPREREVLRERLLGGDEGQTANQLAERHGVTAARIRQLEAQLRGALAPALQPIAG